MIPSSSSSLPVAASVNIITAINQLPRRKLISLAPAKIKQMIVTRGENVLSVQEQDYTKFGHRFHIIPRCSSVHLYRWMIDKVPSEKVTLIMNSFKAGCLSKLIKEDYEPMQKLINKKIVKDFCKFQNQLFEESVKHEVNLLKLNQVQFQAWLESSDKNAALVELCQNSSPILPEIKETVIKRYGEEGYKNFEEYLRVRSAGLAFAALNQVCLKKARYEKIQIGSFLHYLNEATSEDDILKNLYLIYQEISNIKRSEQSYLSQKNSFNYNSHFRSEYCLCIHFLLENTQQTPQEKKELLMAYLGDIGDRLDNFISKAKNQLDLFKPCADMKNSQTLIDKFQKCIFDDETPFQSRAGKILDECRHLVEQIGTKDAFLAKIEAVGDDLKALQDVETDLDSILPRVTKIKRKAMDLSNKIISKREYSMYTWKGFLATHRSKAKITARTARFIDSHCSTVDQLAPHILHELNVRHRIELATLLNSSMSLQFPRQTHDMIWIGSDKPLALRKEEEWGIHHKVAWQRQVVREKIKLLTPLMPEPVATLAASSSQSSETIEVDEEEEKMDIVTKIAELGIDPSVLEKAPFNIPKPLFYDEEQEVLKVDWMKYAEFFINKGIKFSDIEDIPSFASFIQWYEEKFVTD